MPRIAELQERYRRLERTVRVQGEEAIDTACLLAFDNEDPGPQTEVSIETEEFTAVCPWTGLPDYGRLTIAYVPGPRLIELKSLKYYLLSFRDVGVVQERAANRILNDLVALCQPRRMRVALDYNVRGGLHTTVTVTYPVEGQG